MRHVDKYLCKRCRKPSFFPIAGKQPKRTGIAKAGRKEKNRTKVAPDNSFIMFNHQNKGNAYFEALKEWGYNSLEQSWFLNVKIILTDSDILGRRHILDKYRAYGCKNFFVIPHTARPNLVNDVSPGWQHTTAYFCVTKYHAEVMQIYGIDKPIHPVGWSLCPIKKFTPRKQARNILFAPIHPRCSQIDKDVNLATFKKLEKLARQDDIVLTVRFIRNLHESGLEKVEHPNIKYTVGYMNQAYDQIDNADVVIGHQTIAWLAVARGTPTLMMAERKLKTHIEPRRGGVSYARNWNKYVDKIAYPLDILDCDDTLGLLNKAIKNNCAVSDWKRRMIGNPFRKDRFLEAIHKYL